MVTTHLWENPRKWRYKQSADVTISIHHSLFESGKFLSLINIIEIYIHLIFQHEVEQLIEYHVRWMEERGFTKHFGCWMYALLVKLEKPLTPEMCSLLRNLARLCSKIRCDLMSADNPLLPQLNLFICLVGRYFDQSDLADK